MLWTVIATAIMGLSALASGATTLRLFLGRRWGVVDRSCASFLFFLLFIYLWIWCTARTAYYIWVCLGLRSERVASKNPFTLISRLAPVDNREILRFENEDSGWITALICLGDTALFGVAIVSFPLVYELFRIAAHTMDRGVKLERARIRLCRWVIHALLLLFVIIQLSFAIAFGGYTMFTRGCLLAVYVLQVISFVYMVALLIALKIRGRQHESIHGVLVKSPIYSRLKRIMLVYTIFMLQFQVCSIVFYIAPRRNSSMKSYIGVTMLTYNATGLVLSVVASCSQTCVLRGIGCCLPNDAEAQLYGRSVRGIADPAAISPLPPPEDPVFVVTDIESSSALWGIGDGRLMQEATEIHDSVLRARLAQCRGYEIATCGDSFQLAFHSIHDAVRFCLLVQLDLLAARWPKRLHNIVAATRKQRAGAWRVIFRGLRVRMGIHDSAPTDGGLVYTTHAVTGKLTYTGASKLIVDEISDIGSGGQIVVTRRIADWLHGREDIDGIRFVLARVKEYSIPHIRATLELFQVVPASLKARLRRFPSLRSYQIGTSSLGRGGNSAMGASAPNIACLLEWRVGITASASLPRQNSREPVERHVAEPEELTASQAFAELASPY